MAPKAEENTQLKVTKRKLSLFVRKGLSSCLVIAYISIKKARLIMVGINSEKLTRQDRPSTIEKSPQAKLKIETIKRMMESIRRIDLKCISCSKNAF